MLPQMSGRREKRSAWAQGRNGSLDEAVELTELDWLVLLEGPSRYTLLHAIPAN
jgi:hypothetical protein